MRKQSQCKKLIKYFDTGRSLTSMGAFKMFGITRLASRAHELMNTHNYGISKTMITINGHTITKYRASAWQIFLSSIKKNKIVQLLLKKLIILSE